MNVMVSSGKWNAPYVANVIKVVKKTKLASVKWYYLPKETKRKAQRQLQSMKIIDGAEVFRSNHTDVIPLSTIMGECRVLDYGEYKVGLQDIYTNAHKHKHTYTYTNLCVWTHKCEFV